MTEFDWRRCFFIMSAVALNGLPVGIIMYSSRKFYQTGNGVRRYGGSFVEGETSTVTDVSLLKDPAMLLLSFNCLMLYFCGMVEPLFIVDLTILRGYGRKRGSVLLMVTGIGNLVGRGLAVCLRQLFKDCSPSVCHWTYILLLAATSHALLVYLEHYWPLLCACLLNGISIGAVFAQTATVVYEMAGVERYPRALALMHFTTGVGIVLAGIVGGVIKDLTGNYDLLFITAAVISVYIAVSSVLLTYIVRRRQMRNGLKENEKLSPLNKHSGRSVDKKYLRLTNRRGTVF